ncbi:MAG: proton-conducting transporter membrane subunit, partial [Thermoproteus sp.]
LFLFVSGIYTAVSTYSLFYMRDAERRGWFWMWMDVFFASMLLFVSANYWALLLAGWAGLDLASWGLILTYRDGEEVGRVGLGDAKWGLKWLWEPSDSALRAILAVEVGSASLAAALVLMVLRYGPYISSWGPASGLAAALFLIAAFAKGAQLPFTDWLMTAMSAPTPVSALLHSSTMVTAGPLLLIRLSGLLPSWAGQVAFAVGVLTAAYGGLVALGQKEPKVLLAASTASYLGLMTAFALKDPEGALALVYAHGVAKASLFLAVGHAIHEDGSRTPSAYPLASKVAIFLSLLTLAGLTPLGALAKEGEPLWGLFFSVLTAGYLGRLLVRTENARGVGPLAPPYLALAAAPLLVPAALPNPIWALSLVGLGLAYIDMPEALYRRLGLPLLFDLALPKAFRALASAVAKFDSAVDRALLLSPALWRALAVAVKTADWSIDAALHEGLVGLVRRTSVALSERDFEYYLYIVGVAAAVAIAAAIWLLR